MSKIVILGDLHAGARNASMIVCNYQLSFFENELFPYMIKHKISTILQLGDIFDSRKFSNHNILQQWKTRFFVKLKDHGFKMITLLGNHDIASRNTREVNAPMLFLSEYSEFIDIITDPVERKIEGLDFLLIPWILPSEENDIKNKISTSDAMFCAGHFEISGFSMQRGVPANNGISPGCFSRFDAVISGHFHTRSKKKNILYTGVPYELTWADYNDQKGFHVLDTNSHRIEFVPTITTLFEQIVYDDSKNIPSSSTFNVTSKYVKVVVSHKENPYEFDKFITGLLNQAPQDLKITDIEIELNTSEEELILEDTKSSIEKYIDQLETSLDKSKVKNLIGVLYLKALEITE